MAPRLAAWLVRLRQPIVWRRAEADRLTTITLRQWPPLVLLGVALAWYTAAPTPVAAMSVAALGGLLLCAFVWAANLASFVSAERALRHAAMQVGDELEEAITLTNASPLPALWAEFGDHSDLPGYALASVRAVDGNSQVRWRARAVCTRRGRFTLGPWELRLGDPLGLFLVQQTYLQPQELVVYPPLAALPRRLLPHTPTQGDHRLLRQPLPAETINAITTRPYVAGDPLRRLHWPTTARRGAFFTKLFEPEATSSVWLVADFDPAAHLGDGDDSTEETLVLVAASLAAQLLQQGLAAGLIAAQGEALTLVPPRPGPAHLWQHLRALAPLRATPGTLPLSGVLPKVRSVVTARDLVLVLTPAVPVEWPTALLQVVRRGARAEVILLDPASFGGHTPAASCVPMLAGLGLGVSVIQRGEVKALTAVYGALRRWEFLTTGTGRAVALQTPRGASSIEAQWAALQARPR